MTHDRLARIRSELLNLYVGLRKRAATDLPLELIGRLGCPFLVCPRSKWPGSDQRILLIGQEPFEWGFPTQHYDWPHPPVWSLREFIEYGSSVAALMDAYCATTYEIKYPGPLSPFTKTFKYLLETLGIGQADVINTNLFRTVMRIEGRPKARSPVLYTSGVELQQILAWQRRCLSTEIQLLNPTAVVFLTGPRYDSILLDEFPDARFEAVDEYTARQFARVFHEALPNPSFRTYHPGFLVRGRWSWIEQLGRKLVFGDTATGRRTPH